MSTSRVSHRRGSVAGRADPNVPYRIEEFLDDQVRLLACGARRGRKHPDTFETPDQRSRRVYTAELREALGDAGVERAFVEKYGPGSAERHLRRFELVLDFLDECREKIVWRCFFGMPLQVSRTLI